MKKYTELAEKELINQAPKSPSGNISMMLKKEALDQSPKTLTCPIHGEYKARVAKSFLEGRYMYNDLCVDCIAIHSKLVEARAIEIEAEDLEKQKQDRLLRRAEKLKDRGVSKRYLSNSFDNYIADTPEKQNALHKVKELCQCIANKKNASNLIMVGGVGTGKTHLANSAIIELTDLGFYCGRQNMIDMLRRLKATWSKDSEETEEDVLHKYTSADLLIIDEVGIQFGSDTEKMFIFDIINGRYEEELPTVIISNLDVAGVKEIIGERCVDRLKEDGGKVVAFNWESNRGK